MEKGKRKEVESSHTQDDYIVNFTRDNFQRDNKRTKTGQERYKTEASSSSYDQAARAMSFQTESILQSHQEKLKAVENSNLLPVERQNLVNRLQGCYMIEVDIQDYRQKHSDLSQREQNTLEIMKDLSLDLSCNIAEWAKSLNSGGTVMFKEWWEENHQDKEKYLKALKRYFEIPDKLQTTDGENPQQVLQMQKKNLESLADSLHYDRSHIGTIEGRMRKQRRSECDGRVKLCEDLEKFHSSLTNNSNLSQESQKLWMDVRQAQKENLDKLADLNKLADDPTLLYSLDDYDLYKRMDDRVKFCNVISNSANDYDLLPVHLDAWCMTIEAHIKSMDASDGHYIKKLRQNEELLQAPENPNLPPERRQSLVDNLQEHGDINEMMERFKNEYNKLNSKFNDALRKLQDNDLSLEQRENLRKNVQATVDKLNGGYKTILDDFGKINTNMRQFTIIHENLSNKLIELTPVLLSLAQRENTKPDDHRNRLGIVNTICYVNKNLIEGQEKLASTELTMDWADTILEIHSSSCKKFDEMLKKHKEILDYVEKNKDLSQEKQETLVAIEKISRNLLYQIQNHNKDAQNNIEHFCKQVYTGPEEVSDRWHGRWMKIFTNDCERYLTALVGSLEISDKLQQAEGEKPQQAGRMLEENLESLAKALAQTRWQACWEHWRLHWTTEDDQYRTRAKSTSLEN